MTERRRGTGSKPILPDYSRKGNPTHNFESLFDKTRPVGEPSPLDEKFPSKDQSWSHHDRRPWLMPGKEKPPSSK